MSHRRVCSLKRICSVVALFVLMATMGCVTRPKIDWSSRIGAYTYDRAVIDLGPPDKSAKLSDGTNVAEWMTQKGRYSTFSYGYGYEPYPYGPYGFYPGFAYQPYDIIRSPEHWLRLVFDPSGKLRDWRRFDK